MKYYVFATGYRGLGTKSMKQAIKHKWLQFDNICFSLEEAQERAKWLAKNVMKENDRGYIFNGNEVIANF